MESKKGNIELIDGENFKKINGVFYMNYRQMQNIYKANRLDRGFLYCTHGEVKTIRKKK